MGRLGGAELGYGSDADVMFVCEAAHGVDDAAAVKWATSVAEQVRSLLGTPSVDPPLEVDANLRPEGRSGRWSAPWGPTPPTTSNGRNRGRFRRCCAPARWPATRSWVSGSC